MNLLRGALLAGKFRTQQQLNGMSHDDMRNTLIVEMSGRSNQPVPHFQAMDDAKLAGTAAMNVFLEISRIRTVVQLKAISDDDQRNIMIVEINGNTGLGASLQGFSNMDLVLLGLGNHFPGSLTPAHFTRGVLLAGRFRTHHELNAMSADDQRNTLIVEMAAHSNQSNFQSFNDFDLAGAGAVMVFLREAGIRNDSQLKAMSIDDQRNVMIVVIGAQTGLGSALQGLRNMDLVRIALGADATAMLKPLPPPLHPLPALPFIFSADSVEIKTQKADGDHSDSDWLSIVITVMNPITKSTRTKATKPIQVGGNIKSGTLMTGPFKSDPIDALDTDIVYINYVLTNLGSSKAEEQFAQAVKVTDKIVGVVAPIAGAVIGFFFGTPQEGLKVGQEIAKGLDTAISTLSDVFDFLHIHAGPPNCNGVVLQDTLSFMPNELAQAVNQPASREYTGTQESERCGDPPVTKINFSILRLT